jgi:predicted secreted acid phosphatase
MAVVRSFARAGILGVAIAIAGCASPLATREPPNLFPLKQQIRAYVDGGDYQREIERVAAEARSWIDQRVARGGSKLTIVFDLDETLFLNWPYLSAMDFGYIRREWERWVGEAKAPPVESVRELYRAARRQQVEVVFLTGRPETMRASTERNLSAIDCGDYTALICKPAADRGTSAAFKTRERQRLVGAGHVIIANIGDQQSDLVGGFAERTFKLPNPFYVSE